MQIRSVLDHTTLTIQPAPLVEIAIDGGEPVLLDTAGVEALIDALQSVRPTRALPAG